MISICICFGSLFTVISRSHKNLDPDVDVRRGLQPLRMRKLYKNIHKMEAIYFTMSPPLTTHSQTQNFHALKDVVFHSSCVSQFIPYVLPLFGRSHNTFLCLLQATTLYFPVCFDAYPVTSNNKPSWYSSLSLHWIKALQFEVSFVHHLHTFSRNVDLIL
ncbi:unnamed protein product [Tenebrio molitor]|nr:unnamed protein product [Tenebrio molitor]